MGFNVRSYNGKCLIKPQKEKVIAKRREIKEWLKSHINVEAADVIRYLNPIIRGWGNYYKHSVAKEIFASLDHDLVHPLLRWARKKHGKRKTKWIRYYYFGRVGGDNWVFKAKTKNRKGRETLINIIQLAKIPIVRHVKVKLDTSPDDPDMRDYWEKRLTRYGRTRFSDGSKLQKVAINQGWKCPVCGEHLLNGEEWDTHHKLPVREGGTDEETNLVHVHKTCHINLHRKFSHE
ncbi:HNH endonuclease signature motif containing protein [Chroococcus sp. FPU101]|uniref:group II intron reverse transcriptase n=1 Tax=Chroococcus sp. FPU101 TaxID=1974212 RepID=UPI001A901C09|nr:HNH endonuclease signature motif containing protein [Chroococcus sp. FPU101]GFE69370.1 hypothetical protein CFPU101_19800 [Chroococcus sp. FPU101]